MCYEMTLTILYLYVKSTIIIIVAFPIYRDPYSSFTSYFSGVEISPGENETTNLD